MQEIAKNIYSSSIKEQDDVVKENFPSEECGKTDGTKASVRTHEYNQGQEHGWAWRWRVAVASPLPPPGDSHMEG